MTRQSKATWREKQRSLLTLCHLTFITAPHAWLCRSNLVDMAQDTSIQFGQDPPLFSKPPGWKPPAAAQRPQDTFQAHNPIHRCLSSPCQILTMLQSSVVAPGQSCPLPLKGQYSRRSMVLGYTRPKSEPFCRDARNGLLVQSLP